MKLFRVGLLLAVFAACAACTAMGGSQQSTAQTDQPQPTSSARERFAQVLRLLENGNAAAARVELIAYLEQQPSSEVGRDLLRQIDTPAEEYFPQQYRVVELEPGESLSTLAEEYLGDLYQFHALAKYNGIAQPRQLELGQSIKIPLTDYARSQFDAPASPASAPAAPAAVSGANQAEPGQRQQQVDALHRQALNEFRAQNLDNAIALWDEVLLIDPGHDSARLYRNQALELKEKLTQIE